MAKTNDLREAFGDVGAEQAIRAAAMLDVRDRERQALRVFDAERWYVGHGSGDARAIERLKEAGLEYYYPLTREFRPTPKKRLTQSKRNGLPVMKEILRPLFKNYFFVRFDLRDGIWRETFELAGISGLIANERSGALMPAPIADATILEIKAREVDGAIPGNARARKIIPFAVGDAVRIEDGALEGHNGTVDWVPDQLVEELDDHVKLKVLVSLFGRATVVELPVTSISAG